MAQDILKRLKANRVKIGVGEPHVNEGVNGDFSLRRTTSGVVLYIKHENKWYSIGQLQAVGGRGQGRSEGKHKTKTDDLEVGRQIVIDGKGGRQLKLTANEIDCGAGTFTIDSASDIDLNADGGQVTIKDDTASHFLFDCDNTTLTIYDDADQADYFKIVVDANGATTLESVDGGASAANILMKADGSCEVRAHEQLKLDARNTSEGSGGDIMLLKGLQQFGYFFAGDGVASDLRLFERGGSTSDDWFQIRVGEHGATTLTTYDTAGAQAHFEIASDGTITLDAAAGVYLDSGDGRLFLQAAGTTFGNIQVDTTSQLVLYEQGGATSDDYLKIETATNGATTISTVDAAGTSANLKLDVDGYLELEPTGNDNRFSYVHIDGSAGFTQAETTYSDDSLTSSGGSNDTDIDFRNTNKRYIQPSAGTIVNLNLIFPNVSGNFLLYTRSAGAWAVTNWKVYEYDLTAATGFSGAVAWPGGTAPTLTNAGYDVISFYWDASNQRCFGQAGVSFS